MPVLRRPHDHCRGLCPRRRTARPALQRWDPDLIPMTFHPLPWQHPFARTFRSRRRHQVTLVPANTGTTSRTSPRSGHRTPAAPTTPLSSPALSSWRSSQNHPPLQPLRRQIAIVGQALTAFPRVPSSEAFERRPPSPGSIAHAGPASETLTESGRSRDRNRTGSRIHSSDSGHHRPSGEH